MTAIDEPVTGDETGELSAATFRDSTGYFATGVTSMSLGAHGGSAA